MRSSAVSGAFHRPPARPTTARDPCRLSCGPTKPGASASALCGDYQNTPFSAHRWWRATRYGAPHPSAASQNPWMRRQADRRHFAPYVCKRQRAACFAQRLNFTPSISSGYNCKVRHRCPSADVMSPRRHRTSAYSRPQIESHSLTMRLQSCSPLPGLPSSGIVSITLTGALPARSCVRPLCTLRDGHVGWPPNGPTAFARPYQRFTRATSISHQSTVSLHDRLTQLGPVT